MLGILILATLASGPVQGVDFFSSLDQDNRTCACPGETVTYVCVVPDPSGGLRDTRWSGTILQGQCPTDSPPDEISLSHEQFIVNEMESGTCGHLTAEIANNVTGADIEFNSTLPVTATTDLDGRTVVCSGPGASVGQFVEIGSATLTLTPVPAPIITVTELSPESVRVSVPDYPEESVNCGLTFTVEGTTPGETVPPQTSNTLTVNFPGLNLCTNVYTFNASVTSGSRTSGSMTEVFDSDLTTLDCDTNLRCDGICDVNAQTLFWDAPTNLPNDCNVVYQIEVDGVPRSTTTDTSVSVADLGLSPCDGYNITVTPDLIDQIGQIERCKSQQMVILAQGFPTPRISTIDFIYTPQGIAVNITWENDLLPQFANALVLFGCGSEDICTPVNLSDSSSSHSLTLSYSVLGLDIEFSVTFFSPFCQRRMSITTSFSSILESVDISDVTHNTAEVVVVYNSSISTLEGYTVRATIYPQNSTSPVQLFTQEVPFPPLSAFEDQLTFSFTGLEADTDYVFDVRILSTGIVIGRAESSTFTTESEPESGGLSTGTAVGISIAVTFFGTFVLGMLFGAAIVYVITVKRQMKSNYEPSTAQNVQGAPVYEEPELIASERKIDTAANVAYGHTRF